MPADLGSLLRKSVATILKLAAHSPCKVTTLIQLLLFICAAGADSGDGMTENLKKRIHHRLRKGKTPNTMHFLSLTKTVFLFSLEWSFLSNFQVLNVEGDMEVRWGLMIFTDGVFWSIFSWKLYSESLLTSEVFLLFFSHLVSVIFYACFLD